MPPRKKEEDSCARLMAKQVFVPCYICLGLTLAEAVPLDLMTINQVVSCIEINGLAYFA